MKCLRLNLLDKKEYCDFLFLGIESGDPNELVSCGATTDCTQCTADDCVTYLTDYFSPAKRICISQPANYFTIAEYCASDLYSDGNFLEFQENGTEVFCDGEQCDE